MVPILLGKWVDPSLSVHGQNIGCSLLLMLCVSAFVSAVRLLWDDVYGSYSSFASFRDSRKPRGESSKNDREF